MTIELPAGADPSDESDTTDDEPHAHAPPTVLVDDDEPEVRVMTARILLEHGFEVVEAHSGREALSRAREDGFDPAHLLSDVVMSGISGVDLAGVFRALHPRVGLLLMSGYAHDEVDGNSDIPLLMKPFSEEELLGAVRQALDRRGVASVS